MKKSILIAIVVLSTAGISLAQDRTQRVDNRQTVQRERIHQGRASGEVTRSEAAALNADQRHIRRAERRSRADGDVTAREKRRLDRHQDRASRRIHRAKHNQADAN